MGRFDRSGTSQPRLSSDILGARIGQSPDPSKYQPRVLDFKIDKGHVKFDRTPRITQNKIEISPGPSHYQVKDSITQPKGFSNNFNKSQTNLDEYLKLNLDTTPSPGNYEATQKHMKNFITYQWPKAKKIIKKNENPGPGAYNPQKILKKEPSA